MFCSRCGQTLEGNDRFCPKCGQKIEEFQPVESNAFRPDANFAQPPSAYPYQPPAAPVGIPPKKKNPWLVPIIVIVAVLVVLLFIVGGILVYTVYRTIEEDQTSAPASSKNTVVIGEKELSGFLGQTVDTLKSRTGVPLFANDGAYTNLDGSILATVGSGGTIDMLVISDRDVGFTICGVSVDMSLDEAAAAASAKFPGLEKHEDMIAGQQGDSRFAAYCDEFGKVNYVMYFTGLEEESSGTNASVGTGIWYLGETLQTVWDYFGEGYELLPAADSTNFSYPNEGFSFITQDTDYTGQSVVSAVWIYQNAWFSDEIFIGMDYHEIRRFVDLSEIYQNRFTGAYQADFSMYLDGWECYGSFTFDGADELSASTEAYIARG